MVAFLQTGELEPVLVAAREGDPIAFKQLSDGYLAGLTTFAARRNAEDPEEIANMALYDGFSNLYRFRSHTSSSFRAYLFQCAANRINTEHRKKKPILVPLSDDSLPLRSALQGADDIIASDEWFNQAIVALPVDQRAVIKERFGEGRTIAETAQRLGKSADSIKNLQERALHRLRRDLVLAGAVLALIVLITMVLSSRPGDVIVESTPADDGTFPPPQADPALDDGRGLMAPEGARSTGAPTVSTGGDSPSVQTSIFSNGSASDGSTSEAPDVASTVDTDPETDPTAPVLTPSPDTSANAGPAESSGVPEQQPDTSMVAPGSSSETSTSLPEGEEGLPQGSAAEPQDVATPALEPGTSAEGTGASSGKSGGPSDGPGKASKGSKGSKESKGPKSSKGDNSSKGPRGPHGRIS